ncbi:MAG: hypothetical protein LBH78_03580 [Rickettsiales bacterium]|jgi:hypothetical protein|nr:hypothetical protein [Rickettsiales bacterium]
MTSFDDIHENVEGYKKDVEILSQTLEDVCQEKQKNADLVAWFRLRKRMIKQSLEPMQSEIDDRISQSKNNIKAVSNASDELKRIKNQIDSENERRLERKLEEVLNEIPYESSPLTSKLNFSLEEINSNIAISERILEQIQVEQDSYKKALQEMDQIINFFRGIRKASDIDVNLSSEYINQSNVMIKKFNLKAGTLEPLPETYDPKEMEERYLEIREQVHQIDGRYPMRLFLDLRRTLRKIIHDVGNDRGIKAFSNRSSELIETTNQGIDMFNKKYWQITGQRWERIGTNKHGYKKVHPTHDKISLI